LSAKAIGCHVMDVYWVKACAEETGTFTDPASVCACFWVKVNWLSAGAKGYEHWEDDWLVHIYDEVPTLVASQTFPWDINGSYTSSAKEAVLCVSDLSGGTHSLTAKVRRTTSGYPDNVWQQSPACTVHVVEVSDIEINYSGANWASVGGQTIVVLKGTEYTFKAIKAPPSESWPLGPPVWSGAASGTGETIVATFDTVGTTTLTAKCNACDDGETVTIKVKEPTPYQIGFGGDHTLYKTPAEWDGWGDGSTVITDPVYDADSSKNDEVCVSKSSSSVSLTNVKLKVDEALTYATPISIDATGTEEWNETGTSFSGMTTAPGTLNITGSIIGQVKRYVGTFETTWKYKVPSGTNTWYTIGTVNHTVYVTYDTPQDAGGAAGANLTVQRIDRLCQWANGKSTRKDVADEINDNLSLPFGTGTHDDWGLMCGSCGFDGECDEHAVFMTRCLDLIGVSGSSDYLTYASEDADPLDKDDKWLEMGDEQWRFYLKFDADGDGEVDNNFEGSVKVPINDSLTTFHYYTVTPKVNASSVCLLWRAIGPNADSPGGGTPGAQDWEQVWIHTPTGQWKDAWPPESTIVGAIEYVSCP